MELQICLGLFLLIFSSCYHESETKFKADEKAKNSQKGINFIARSELGPGVLKYLGRQSIKSDSDSKVIIENPDGSLYWELNLLNDSSIILDFYPLAMFLEHDILVFEVIKKLTDEMYLVKINNSRGQRIKKINITRNTSLKFMSWKDYFLATDVILDLPKRIKVFNAPNGKKIENKIDFDFDEFIIKEINGYWMKLEIIHFDNDEYEEEQIFNGWIRWRNKSELLIEIGILGK